MTIKIEQAKLENVAISLKAQAAKLRFSTSELEVLPDEVRDALSLLERTRNAVWVTLSSSQGEVLLELPQCKVSAADIKIGPGRGVLGITTGHLRQVWEARELLRHYLLAELETVTVVLVEQQMRLEQLADGPEGTGTGEAR